MLKKLSAATALLAVLLCVPAHADDGHDHGVAPAPAAGPALPRFAATSDLFELVGVVDGTRLTVYLDRFDTNAPVKGARVDLDVGGAPVALQPVSDGSFEGRLATALPPGRAAVTATVVAGDETDLLAGDIDVPEAAHTDDDHGHGGVPRAAWLVLGAAVTLALAWTARRAMARRATGGAA